MGFGHTLLQVVQENTNQWNPYKSSQQRNCRVQRQEVSEKASQTDKKFQATQASLHPNPITDFLLLVGTGLEERENAFVTYT